LIINVNYIVINNNNN